MIEFSSRPCFWPGARPLVGRKVGGIAGSTGCLEPRGESATVQIEALALIVLAHDKATVDAVCIPAGK